MSLQLGIGKGFLMRYQQVQSFGNIRPGFGYQATRQRQGLSLNQLHQQPEPAQAEKPRAAWAPAATQPQERAQIGQLAAVAGAELQIAAKGDHPQRGDRHRQPQACHPIGLAHLGVLRLPAATFGAGARLLAPRAQSIPLRVAAVGQQIGQHEPRFFVTISPPRQQRAVQLAVARDEGRTSPAPALPNLLYQVAEPHELDLIDWSELAALIDAQERVPAQTDNPTKQPAGVQAAIGQNQHHPRRWDGRAQHPQHAQPLTAPSTFLCGWQDGPRHRNATAARDHADGQDHKLVAQAARIDRQRDLLGGPQAHNPPQQGHKTDGDVQIGTVGAGFVCSIETPFVQALFEIGERLLDQQGQEGRHRAAATRARAGNAKAPQRQDRGLWFGKVRHVG